MASKEDNRAAALKQYEGRRLTQDEERALARARNTSGSESRTLDRIVSTGRDK